MPFRRGSDSGIHHRRTPQRAHTRLEPALPAVGEYAFVSDPVTVRQRSTAQSISNSRLIGPSYEIGLVIVIDEMAIYAARNDGGVIKIDDAEPWAHSASATAVPPLFKSERAQPVPELSALVSLVIEFAVAVPVDPAPERGSTENETCPATYRPPRRSRWSVAIPCGSGSNRRSSAVPTASTHAFRPLFQVEMPWSR